LQVIPVLSISYLCSVGQLVDADCSVNFKKEALRHKNVKILEVQRNFRNGLWKVDLQSKTTHPALGHTPPAIDGKFYNNATHLVEEKCEAHSIYECNNK
jgi:hypothetical protein